MMKLRKRALMEASNTKGGEIRKVHIIYFLSRSGHVEQPHLIRVHHLAATCGGGGSGVYLRDVKRWLGELRGKDMPEAFSWSYKRKYKTGYVWQDLVDDDLITPISDNEYVLQGSQIIFPTTLFDTKKSLFREEFQLTQDFSSKLLQKNLQQSPPCDSERSTVTDDGDSMKVEEETTNNCEMPLKQGIEKEIHEIEGFKTQYSSFYAKLVKNNKEKDKDKDLMEKEGGPTATSTVTSASQPAFTKSKSYSSGASNMLRHWITCGPGAVDTNDTVLIKNRSPKDPPNQPPLEKLKNDAVFCRDELLGGSARVIGNSWDGNLEIRRQYSHHTSRKSFDDSRKKRPKEGDVRKVAATVTYKPMAGPNCSLCGKTFKPEKMHSHMKSCRGIKSLTKTASSSNKTTSSKSTTTTISDKDLAFTYLLTN